MHRFANFIRYGLLFQVLLVQITLQTTLTDNNEIDSDPYEDVEHHTLTPGSPAIEAEALKFLIDVNKRSYSAYRELVIASWNYETGITNATESAKVKAEAGNYKFEADIQKEVMQKFPDWETFDDVVLKRMFSNFAIQGPGNMSQENIQEMTEILTKMQTDYATTRICDYKDKTKCDLRIDRDINKRLAGSNDLDEKSYYWTEWHNSMSKKVTPALYEKFVNYQNNMAQANDFENMGAMWVTQYNDYSDDWTPESFKQEIHDLEEEVRPFYNKLHAYVRMKLRNNPDYVEKIPKTGHLPIHILGNLWGQDWVAVDELTKPYPGYDLNSVQATKALKEASYTPTKMFREADRFFTDLGLIKVPETFWEYSRFERPSDGKDVVCHPSAWYFINGTDVRITMCAEVTLDDLVTIHHEMGHIQYFLQYRNLPHVFQDGANPGFHEAVGDSLALSILNPTHLQCTLKLDLGMPSLCQDSHRAKNDTISEWELNFLYITALQKIPFLFFSYALEEWRWKVFNLSITKEDYNKEWWAIRSKIQGIVPPSDRSSPELFDPAGKFHIVSNEPYISYFVSSILQFQFYDAMCHASGQYNKTDTRSSLYKCDIAGSKSAGKLLSDMMKLGCSTDWRTALEKITGTRKMSAKPLLEYFKPLITYIDNELQKNNESPCYGDYCQSEKAS